jgi:hypothetical protein
MGEAAVALTPHVDATVTELTLGEEAELRAFFMLYLPPAPGSASSFGAMCARVANIRNPATNELPTPLVIHCDGTATGAPWTEILDCSTLAHATTDGEDAMIAHVDALRRMHRVRRALGQLTPHEQDVLSARYAENVPAGPLGAMTGVAALTSVIAVENRRRAAADRHETVEATVASLIAASDSTSKTDRARDRAMVNAARREASALLDSARASYAQARRACR